MEEQLAKIREMLANYMWSEGCSCCQDYDNHKLHRDELGKLLNVPEYEDGSGHNFSLFRTYVKD